MSTEKQNSPQAQFFGVEIWKIVRASSAECLPERHKGPGRLVSKSRQRLPFVCAPTLPHLTLEEGLERDLNCLRTRQHIGLMLRDKVGPGRSILCTRPPTKPLTLLIIKCKPTIKLCVLLTISETSQSHTAVIALYKLARSGIGCEPGCDEYKFSFRTNI